MAPSGESFQNTFFFFCAWFSRFTEGTCRTRRITLREPRKITTDHDMRPIRLTANGDFLILEIHRNPEERNLIWFVIDQWQFANNGARHYDIGPLCKADLCHNADHHFDKLGQYPSPCAFARKALNGYWSRVHSWDMNVPFMN